MKFRYLKLITNGARTLLLSISLLACVTFWLWKFQGALVNQFGGFVVKTYQESYLNRLTLAISAASKSPKEGVVHLAQLLDDLSMIHKLDRLDGIKRTAFQHIVDALHNMNRNEEALAWTKRWIEFDERDIYALIWRARLMRKSPATYEVGWMLINELYKKIPHSILIVTEYVEYLIMRGQFADAYIAAYKAFKKQDSLTGREWQIFWDTGDGFNAKQTLFVQPVINAKGRLSLTFDVPVGVVRLRIDLPTNARINLFNPTILIGNGADQVVEYSLLDGTLGLSQIVRNGLMLVSTGGHDPHFFWETSDGKTSGERLVFSCNVEETVPVVVKNLARHPNLDLDVVESLLFEKNEIDAAKLLRELSIKEQDF